jgi:hypothetical protein
VAGQIADNAPLLALELYGANPVNSGDALIQGSIAPPLDFAGGLGGVGVSSVGGTPFMLPGQDKTVTLFSTSLTALRNGTNFLELTGYPYVAGTALSLAGERVPVTLQAATVTVVPLPPALWLFASGVLALLGVRSRKGVQANSSKWIYHRNRVPRRLLFLTLTLATPYGFAAPNANVDLNGDALVNSQDSSILASCFAQDPGTNSACTRADVDEDGDIDMDDFSFVSARLGQAYPWTLFPSPKFFAGLPSATTSATIGDVNGDGTPDMVVVSNGDNKISVVLGNSDGVFQAAQNYAIGHKPLAVALDDVNSDGTLDAVVANQRSDDISMLLGNGDGSFQAQQRYAIGDAPMSVTLGDVNNDSILDVTVDNTFSKYNSVLLGNDDGTLQAQQHVNARGHHLLGDVNSDGILDMVSLSSAIMLGNGDGSFQIPA